MTSEEVVVELIREYNLEDSPLPTHAFLVAIVQAIRKAVAKEREQCVKIAKSFDDSGPSEIPQTVLFFVRNGIADRIRESEE